MIRQAVYDKLVEVAQHKGIVYYRPLALIAGIDVGDPHFGVRVGHILDEINREEHAVGHPLLSAIVVGADTAKPGQGFFECARSLGCHTSRDDDAFWIAELKRVHDFWSSHPRRMS